MSFEKFIYKRRPVLDTPMISVMKSGQLGINQEAYRRYFKDYKYVFFYYDKNKKIIGLEPTNDATSESYAIRVSRDGKLANISGIAFLKYCKIPHENTKAYLCKRDEKEGMIIIELREAQKELPLK